MPVKTGLPSSTAEAKRICAEVRNASLGKLMPLSEDKGIAGNSAAEIPLTVALNLPDSIVKTSASETKLTLFCPKPEINSTKVFAGTVISPGDFTSTLIYLITPISKFVAAIFNLWPARPADGSSIDNNILSKTGRVDLIPIDLATACKEGRRSCCKTVNFITYYELSFRAETNL